MASSSGKATTTASQKKKVAVASTTTNDANKSKVGLKKTAAAVESAATPTEKNKGQTKLLKSSAALKTSSKASEAAAREKQDALARRKPGRPRKSNVKVLPTRKRPFRAAAAKSRRSSDDSSNPVALLDMLAEVASATLEKDKSAIKKQTKGKRRGGGDSKSNPEPASRGAPGGKTTTVTAGGSAASGSTASKKASKKVAGAELVPDQLLTLDQIRMLPDKLLLSYYSELTADEIRRNYSYVCFLVPDKCQQKFTSFGNENRSRMQMKSHLLSHIAELMVEAAHGRSSQRSRFTAEPIPVRKRRLLNEKHQVDIVAQQQKKPKSVAKSLQMTKRWSKPPSILKKKQISASTSTGQIKQAMKMEKSVDVKPSVTTKRKPPTAVIKPPKRRRYVKVLLDDVVQDEEVVRAEVILENEEYDEDGSKLSYDDGDQAHHDHSYTTAEGGKNFPDHYKSEDGECLDDDLNDDDDNGEDDGGCKVRVVMGDTSQGIVVSSSPSGHMSVPASSIPTSNQPTKFRSKQAEMALRQLEAIRLLQVQKNKMLTSSTRSYSSAPMQTEIEEATQNVVRIDVGSLVVQEEEEQQQTAKGYEQEDDDQTVDYVPIITTKAKSKIPSFPSEESALAYDSDLDKAEYSGEMSGVHEGERKLALKYIRMLRLKKKDEHVPLVCRICEGQKCFTAQATLMYHYRSHAGIKPFVCGICQTTFTRQHSLNYHMLIHNNKSRFTCGDCGRQFRHPSHFKEHLRRHTGETPFECTDCGVRFKTRNTYKRHLKTRHGKLLTVNGIVMLTTEEFMKVKTNPKRRGAKILEREGEMKGFEDGVVVASEEQPDVDPDDEDAIAARSLEQQQHDIVQAAVQAIMQETQQHKNATAAAAAAAAAESSVGLEEQEGGEDDEVSYTFYSIGVGTDPLNGKEIIVLEAVPQSNVQHQLVQEQEDQEDPLSADATDSLQPTVECS